MSIFLNQSCEQFKNYNFKENKKLNIINYLIKIKNAELFFCSS